MSFNNIINMNYKRKNIIKVAAMFFEKINVNDSIK